MTERAWHWSPSKAAFYPTKLRGIYEAAGGWPEDAVEVDNDVYEGAHRPEHAGLILAADEHGKPIRVKVQFPAEAGK